MQSPRELIVTFHGVGTPSRVVEGTERNVWVGEAQLIEFLDEVVSRNDIRLTFDDGNDSDVEVALPALLARGLSAEFFPSAGRVGERGFLRAEQIRELATSGMGIGSHGLHHRPWRGLPRDELMDELARARQVLADASGSEVASASCPFGVYDRTTLRALRDAGYERVYTSDGGWARQSSWLQPRNTVHVDQTLSDLIELARSRLLGGVRTAKSVVKRWR